MTERDFREKWRKKTPMVWSHQTGHSHTEDGVNMTFICAADKESDDSIDHKSYGHWEMYSDCGEWYAGGGLWFRNNELVDYDGNFSLPVEFVDKLNEWGFNAENMR